MIDPILTKENALPRDLWGLLSESWKIDPRDGATIFLQKVWSEKIEFEKLNVVNGEILPIGPTTVIGDDVGFVRASA